MIGRSLIRVSWFGILRRLAVLAVMMIAVEPASPWAWISSTMPAVAR